MVQLAGRPKIVKESHDHNNKQSIKPNAKQRASIKWLLSKAYNNKIPEELADPFYKDHEGEEHLKPHVVQGLSSAELYCLALCNLYADPNYSQLSPWGIVQALARKGVYVQAPPDIQLTETVLIQNNPLRISPHMAVIEAMMVLQVREIISNDRIVGTVQRFGPSVHPREMPSDTEEALLLWINRAILAIKDYIQNNNAHEHNLSSAQVESWAQLPLFQDLSDLSDGVGLSSLMAYYCQDELSLTELTLPNPGEPLSVSESIWNLQLIQRVCKDSLPYNVCHFSYEDILYFHESMKQNMLCFLADLYNQLELHPAPNVKLLGSHIAIPIRPGLTTSGIQLRRGYIQQNAGITIPDLRASLYSHTSPSSSSSSSTVTDRNAITKSQSATSTPKRHNSVQERNRKSSFNIFGDIPSGRRSPSSASVVSVPVRRSGTPLDYHEKANSDRYNQKDQRYYANSSEDSEEFVVHRARNVPTLSQVIRSVSPSSQDERSSPASRMSMSRNVSANDEEALPAAGRPSNWSANKTTYAGRRSRRNSITEADSQLTVENFGGSQDNLNRFVISKNPDKQPAIVTDASESPVRYPRRQSSQEPTDIYEPQYQAYEPPPAKLNHSSRDSRDRDEVPVPPHRVSSTSINEGAGDAVFYGKKKFVPPSMDDHFYHSDRDQRDPRDQRDQTQQGQQGHYGGAPNQLTPNHGNNVSGYNSYQKPSNNNDGNVTVFVMNDKEMTGFGEPPLRSTSMTNLSRLSDLPNKPVNIVYLQNSPGGGASNGYSIDRNMRAHPSNHHAGEYHTMPAAAASTRNSIYSPSSPQTNFMTMNPMRNQEQEDEQEDDLDTEDIASQLQAIRLKLEDKRKRIETAKGRLEAAATKQQVKLGKAAYLKAINKDKHEGKPNYVDQSKASSSTQAHFEVGNLSRKKQLSLKDLESKWLTKTEDPCRTPEIENMDEFACQRSLAKMDTSLSELEADINRLTTQQQQIQQHQQQGRQFFLHGSGDNRGGDQPSGPETGKRKTWTVPSGNTNGAEAPEQRGSVDARRSQWGPPKPFRSEGPPPYDEDNEDTRVHYNGENRYSTGKPAIPAKPKLSNVNSDTGNLNTPPSGSSSFRLHSNADSQGNRLFTRTSEESPKDSAGQRPTPPPRQSRASHQSANSNAVHHAPLPTPPPDDMEPQSVSFVHDDHATSSSELASIGSSRKSLQITSGSKTYRITPDAGSPPRPSAHMLFTGDTAQTSLTSSDENPSLNEKGFYIPLDNEGPVRPKPPLRTKSPAKKKDVGTYDPRKGTMKRDTASEYIQSLVDNTPISNTHREDDDFVVHRNESRDYSDTHSEKPRGELVIDEKPNFDSNELDLMEKKKEKILLMSLKRQQQTEEARRINEMKLQRKKEEEERKAEEKLRKREEEKARKQAILESYRMKKLEEADKDGKGWEVQESSTKRFMRPKSASNAAGSRPRPKTIHLSEVDSGANSYSYRPGHSGLRRSDSQNSSTSLARAQGKRGSNNTLYSADSGGSALPRSVRDPWGSTTSLNQDNRRRAVSSSYDRRSRPRDLSTSRIEARSRRDSYLSSQDSLAHRANSTSSLLDGGESEMSSAHRDSDSGVGTCSPPQRRTPSPHQITRTARPPNALLLNAQSSQNQPSVSLPSPSGPGSLPPGLISRRRGFDDGASDISSVASSNMDYSGLRLYKQPTAKSNRSIILNAVEYCVFPGVVNRDSKHRILDEINRSESKHFLIMFRDGGCQYRALYTYAPERGDEILLLHGRGPKQVNDSMFEKFFKYNSGTKCFSQIHTKHLTVTIDAFTIHNALWQGKKPPTTKTRDMALVI